MKRFAKILSSQGIEPPDREEGVFLELAYTHKHSMMLLLLCMMQQVLRSSAREGRIQVLLLLVVGVCVLVVVR